ncbi:helix-turn-helix domain-containing protein [Pseudonocardia endophytica]|uniref:AraC-like DNA-binding protein n=1 Tax=Pseudonocardia endophytica TaxID=401976 RepID=A0A4R1I1D2_PSEEN|nr:AraC family transcriptional regulator [Pseudonocardia endophytica]TCK26239.1 AraC-like DNA-binding protein [Pseudonocardia endophytica]
MSAVDSPLVRFDVHSQDPEYAHEVLREAYSDFSVRTFGDIEHFDFGHTGVRVPGAATFARVRYAAAGHFVVPADAGLFLVVTLGGGTIGFESGRETVRPDLGEPVLTTLDDVDWRSDVDDATVDTVTLEPAMVARVACSVFGTDVGDVTFTSMTPVSDAAARYWAGVAAHVRHNVVDREEMLDAPLVLAEATRSLVTAALVTFPNTGLTRWEQGGRAGPTEPAVLRRALDYIDEHAGEDIGVDDIAVVARISVRGLQSLFRRHRDRTPLEHLRRVRLALAHDDLLVADPTHGDTVAAIAARWGFTNPGRFSVQYREAFGRSPRATLRG